jgi:hypothetical protein
MAQEVAGQTPIPFPLAKTLVNRAWLNVQRKYFWSFLRGDCAIPTPSATNAGTVTVTPGSPTVTPDATALAAWGAIPLITPITTQQFRVGTGTIYNIIGFAGGAATLSQPYVDPTFGPGTGYQISSYYFNAPVQDFLWFESFIDPVSGYPIGSTMTREQVDREDPQRFQDGWPTQVIPYLVNPTPGNFFNFPMFEMWPAPLNNYTYVAKYWRRGAPFVKLTDVPTPPIGEDVILELAKAYSYEWCMVNPDKVQKGDYRFAMGKCLKYFDHLLDDYLVSDENVSHAYVIPSEQGMNLGLLPWVSASEMIGYFPD